jgi:hypothetical protein
LIIIESSVPVTEETRSLRERTVVLSPIEANAHICLIVDFDPHIELVKEFLDIVSVKPVVSQLPGPVVDLVILAEVLESFVDVDGLLEL